MKKIRVGVLFGGKSAEHEVSLQSAKNIIEAIDQKKYEVVLLGIDKSGKWYLNDPSNYLLNSENPKLIKLNNSDNNIAFKLGEKENSLVCISKNKTNYHDFVDVVFPVLHGTYGEDGAIQGFLKMTDIPFVGSDILGSSLCMDKEITKKILSFEGIKNSQFLSYRDYEKESINFNDVSERLGLPLFIKPANMGSSVGISKVKSELEFEEAINLAFKFDTKIIIEEFINGREIECAVLGNDKPIASSLGEVIPMNDFYSYNSKYIDEKGAKLEIPAKVSHDLSEKIKLEAIKTFKALNCFGLARVDFFVTDKDIYVNEVNTLPGFTKISMYPKLWEISGVKYPELIDKLIILAMERSHKNNNLKTDFSNDTK